MKNSTLADNSIDWISAHGDDEETAGVSLLPKDFDEWDWSDFLLALTLLEPYASDDNGCEA